MYNIGILIYPQVEVLDFCGPFEVFRNVASIKTQDEINVFTVSATGDIVDAQGLLVQPSYSFDDCPELDLLVVPGGNGNWLVEQEDYLGFVDHNFTGLDYLLTVCTGAFVPARLDLLTENHPATTHQEGIQRLAELAPEATVLPDVRFTHSQNIIMSGGISAGIDAALYLVSQKWGHELATKVAVYMEYDWRITEPNTPDPSLLG